MSEKIITLNESAIKQELGDLVRQSVEDTLNVLLDEEADRLTNASCLCRRILSYNSRQKMSFISR